MTPPQGSRVRYALLGVVTCLFALAFGVLSAEAESSLGPHRASFAVEVSDVVLLDLGPLGAIQLDSPAAPLGVRVVVHEIPSSAQEVVDGLGADAAAYAQLVSHPSAAVSPALDALVADALGRSAVGAGVGLAVLALMRGSGSRLRLTPRGAAVAGVVTLGVLTVAVVPMLTRDDAPTTPATVLAGTPFEGVEVSGRLSDLVNTWGPTLVAAYEESEAFYDGVATRVAEGFRAAVASPAPRSGWDLPPPVDERTLTTAVLVSDLHCNVSMGRVVRALVAASGAELILNGGDTVVSGTAAEAFCVDAFAEDFTVPVVVSDGNHDSAVTAEQEQAAGWHVLRGKVVEVGGLRILGDTDPTLTSIGSGTTSLRDETVAGLGVRLGRTACAADVDVLLVHNPIAAHPTARDGCARLTLSGHLHRQVGPEETHAGGWTYVSSSSGGGNEGGRTIGTLRTPAELSVIRFTQDGEPFDHAVVRVGPDGVVTIGQWHGFTRTPPTQSTSSTTS